MAFDYKYNPQVTEKQGTINKAQSFINVAVAQLFYTSNLVLSNQIWEHGVKRQTFTIIPDWHQRQEILQP